jgi:hypothetical protein
MICALRQMKDFTPDTEKRPPKRKFRHSPARSDEALQKAAGTVTTHAPRNGKRGIAAFDGTRLYRSRRENLGINVKERLLGGRGVPVSPNSAPFPLAPSLSKGAIQGSTSSPRTV